MNYTRDRSFLLLQLELNNTRVELKIGGGVNRAVNILFLLPVKWPSSSKHQQSNNFIHHIHITSHQILSSSSVSVDLLDNESIESSDLDIEVK